MKNTITIIGAGHQGLAMASHFTANGEKVHLWNRTKSNISKIMETRTITCRGIVNGDVVIDAVSDNINELLTNTIFVTTPSTAHKDIARMLAKIMPPDSVVYLNPGRTFGALDFLETLINCGCKNIPTIVETQSIVYTCRKADKNISYIYALKNHVKMSVTGKKTETDALMERIPQCVRDRFVLVDSFLDTSLGNIGMILHSAPVLMNIGWIESTKHSFLYYYDGISKSLGKLLQKMDNERINVAKSMGIDTISLVEWFDECYGVKGDSIYDCIQKNECYREIDAPKSIEHRYIDEDIPNGLVPVEALGLELGVDVSTISLVIDLANAVREKDYRAIGRVYDVSKVKYYLEKEWE